MTTFYTTATSAAELAEALLLTSAGTVADSSTSSGSSSADTGSSVDEDMMLDFDEDDSPLHTCLASCVAEHLLTIDKRLQSIDLIAGDTDGVISAAVCFVKDFVG